MTNQTPCPSISGMKDHKQPRTLQAAIVYFGDPDRALRYMVGLRWPDGKVTCPTCGRKDVVFLKNQRKWQCKSVHAKRQFSAKAGTIFEDSPVPLDKWLTAVWMLVNCRNGVSSYELARSIGVTQKSAWFMLHRIRLALRSGSIGKLGGPGSEVEADETFVGGKIANMHKSRKIRLEAIRSKTRNVDAWGHIGKTAVMGILDRDAREMRAKVVPNVRRETLQAEILEHVDDGSCLYTDAAGGYRYLPRDRFVHEIVDHARAYVRGRVHTNGMENFWSLLKRNLRGTYVAVEPFHLDRYVDEQVFRFNNRKDSAGKPMADAERFDRALSQVAHKRLTFAEVTGKAVETAF